MPDKTNFTHFGCRVKLFSLKKAMKAAPTYCEPVAMESEDPLFIMYTSGTTDEPTGILHTQAGYLLCAAMTHKVFFSMVLKLYILITYIEHVSVCV